MLKYLQGWVIKENIRVVLHLIEKTTGKVNLSKRGPSHAAGLTEGTWERHNWEVRVTHLKQSLPVSCS